MDPIGNMPFPSMSVIFFRMTVSLYPHFNYWQPIKSQQKLPTTRPTTRPTIHLNSGSSAAFWPVARFPLCQDSLGVVLYAAAQWPVFDFLQRLALRPRLEDDVPKSEDSEEEEEEETGDALFCNENMEIQRPKHGDFNGIWLRPNDLIVL